MATQAELQHLGEVLKERRVRLGLTQAQVAQLAGWHQTEVSELEMGRRTAPLADRLISLGTALGLSPNDIAEIAGWWEAPEGHVDPDDLGMELLREILSALSEDRRQVVLKQAVALAKAERLAALSRKSDEQLMNS